MLNILNTSVGSVVPLFAKENTNGDRTMCLATQGTSGLGPGAPFAITILYLLIGDNENCAEDMQTPKLGAVCVTVSFVSFASLVKHNNPSQAAIAPRFLRCLNFDGSVGCE